MPHTQHNNTAKLLCFLATSSSHVDVMLNHTFTLASLLWMVVV